MQSMRSLRKTASAITVAVLASVLVLAAVVPAQAASFPPRFLRSVGGSGRPGVFAWGVQWNPVTNEMLVGDYLNFQVRRYDMNGNHLGDFWNGNAVGQPYTIAVDPADGAIYVAELKDNPFAAAIAKYDKFGTFLYRINATLSSNPGATRFRAFYPVWMTVEEDTGNIWVLDSHFSNTIASPPRVLQLDFDDATKTVTQVSAWPVAPPDVTTDEQVARLYGIDVADDDRIYVSDAWNGRAYIYDKAGTLLDTFGQAQTGRDNRGVVVNEDRDLLYLVDAQNSDIDVFDLDGNYEFSFSDEGSDAGEFAGGGRAIDLDGQGNVWVGDFGGFETEKYEWDGTPLLSAPDPARRPPTGLLAQPRDVAVDDQTGDIWVADAWAQRFVRFSSSGAFLGAWGERGPGGAFDMNYPRSIAIDPVTRRIWLAQERGHHIQVYNYPTTQGGSPTYVAQIGQISQDDTDPGHFRWPVDVEFFTRTDGTRVAVIGDRMAASVKIFDATTFQELLMIPAPNHGTAIDPATGDIYVVNPSQDRIDIYDQAGTLLRSFGSNGTGDGQFRDGVDGVISQGVLYVSDESQSRVQAFSLDGTFLGKWGSTYGDFSYDFRGTIGLDADAQGRIYVTDTSNDRIQVFDPNLTKLNDASNPPTPTIATPSAQAVLPLAPVNITGTATDNLSVGNVELSIQDMNTGKWWNPSNSSWEAANTRPILAAYSSTTAPATTVSWRYTFTGVSQGGVYLLWVKTRDFNGNLSQVAVRTFGMPGTTPPVAPPPPVLDTVRPNGTVTFPAPNAALPLAPVSFTGQATDNIGVVAVRVAVRDVATGRWWSGSGSTGFSSAFRWWESTLDAPGLTPTGWAWTWTPRVAGSYRILVQARDAAGNVDNSQAIVNFTVTTAAPDGNPPETEVTSPANSTTVPSGNLSIGGSATDDVGLAGVRVSIQDQNTLQYWTGSSWSASPVTVNATLGTPGGTASTWTYGFNAPEGSFVVTATAVDTSSNSDQTPAASAFTASGAPDTQAPVTSVTIPAANQAFALGPVNMSGIVVDNVGATQVRVAIKNNALPAGSNWWNGSGWGAFTYVVATIDVGGTNGAWSYTFNATASGNYGMYARAQDAAGNLGAWSTWRNFSVTP